MGLVNRIKKATAIGLISLMGATGMVAVSAVAAPAAQAYSVTNCKWVLYGNSQGWTCYRHHTWWEKYIQGKRDNWYIEAWK